MPAATQMWGNPAREMALEMGADFAFDPIGAAQQGTLPADIIMEETRGDGVMFAVEAAAAGIDLQLSGHTHAGQIWPFNYLVRLRYPLLAGRYEIDSVLGKTIYLKMECYQPVGSFKARGIGALCLPRRRCGWRRRCARGWRWPTGRGWCTAT